MVPIAGVGILYAILCAGATVTFTYVVDSYRSIAGEAVSILIAFRNTMAFGLSFAIFPWFEKDGFIKVSLQCLKRHWALSFRRVYGDISTLHTDTFCSLGHGLYDPDPGAHFSSGYSHVHIWTEGSCLDKHLSGLKMGCRARAI